MIRAAVHLTCLLRTAELELDIYGRVVSDSVLDILRHPPAEQLVEFDLYAEWRSVIQREYDRREVKKIRAEIQRMIGPQPDLPDPGRVERR